MSLKIPKEWKELRSVCGKNDKILVIGGVDRGKTTLSLYLSSELNLGMVDSDVGQSTIGPPTLITYSSDPFSLKVDDAYFLGSISPEGHLLDQVFGTWKMARREGIVIDTCGLISGFPGYFLKVKKAEIIRPDMVVSIGRKAELSHILRALREEFHVEELPPCPYARKRNKEERRERRERLFKNYFSERKEICIEYNKIEGIPEENLDKGTLGAILCERIYYASFSANSLYLIARKPKNLKDASKIFRSSKVYLISEKEIFERLLGMHNKRGDFISLGIGMGISEEGINAIVPSWVDEKDIGKISLGDLKVSPDGRHWISKLQPYRPKLLTKKGTKSYDERKKYNFK